MRIRTWASALPVSLLALVACADDEQAGPTTPATVELSDLPGTLRPPAHVAEHVDDVDDRRADHDRRGTVAAGGPRSRRR